MHVIRRPRGDFWHANDRRRHYRAHGSAHRLVVALLTSAKQTTTRSCEWCRDDPQVIRRTSGLPKLYRQAREEIRRYMRRSSTRGNFFWRTNARGRAALIDEPALTIGSTLQWQSRWHRRCSSKQMKWGGGGGRCKRFSVEQWNWDPTVEV